MKSLDKVIGYEKIKEELRRVIDMFHNRAYYDALGAKIPAGILLHGDPGMGKTMMARAFAEDMGLPSYELRKAESSEQFMKKAADLFMKAKATAPSVIILDDMDKFAGNEETAAIQSAIDGLGNAEVFVIATANNIRLFPDSLIRAGRFDSVILVDKPDDNDSRKIIEYYLSDKKLEEGFNITDLAHMIRYNSCAQIAEYLNKAAVIAAYERAERISIDHFRKAILETAYSYTGNFEAAEPEDLDKVAWHEAGHAVASEILAGDSAGLVFIDSDDYGYVCGRNIFHTMAKRKSHHIIISLAGKASVEINRGRYDTGCRADLHKATQMINSGVVKGAEYGFAFNSLTDKDADASMVVAAELERYYQLSRELLVKNRDFLTKVHDALLEKKVLLSSDMKAIKATCTISKLEV